MVSAFWRRCAGPPEPSSLKFFNARDEGSACECWKQALGVAGAPPYPFGRVEELYRDAAAAAFAAAIAAGGEEA